MNYQYFFKLVISLNLIILVDNSISSGIVINTLEGFSDALMMFILLNSLCLRGRLWPIKTYNHYSIFDKIVFHMRTNVIQKPLIALLRNWNITIEMIQHKSLKRWKNWTLGDLWMEYSMFLVRFVVLTQHEFLVSHHLIVEFALALHSPELAC